MIKMDAEIKFLRLLDVLEKVEDHLRERNYLTVEEYDQIKTEVFTRG